MTDTSPVPGDGPTERERLTELTDDETDFLADVCTHPMTVDGKHRYPGGWCFDCDRRLRALLAARTPAPSAAQATVTEWGTLDRWYDNPEPLSYGTTEDRADAEDYARLDAERFGEHVVVVRREVSQWVEADRLDAAPTDPGTRRIEVEYVETSHDRQFVGDDGVTCVEGLPYRAESDGLKAAATTPEGARLMIERLCERRDRLRTPGTEETGHA